MGDLSAAEVARHKSSSDCWFIIHGKVYDVTSFLVDHPGGEDALLGVAGKDASEEFEDIGHSDSAKEQMEQFFVGFVEGFDRSKASVKRSEEDPLMRPLADRERVDREHDDHQSVLLKYAIPLLLLCLAFALRFFARKEESS